MELKEIVELLRKEWKSLVASTLICAVVAIVVTYFLPTKYSSRVDVYVKRRDTQESESYYTYDGYYATQASVQYTDTVTGLFQSIQILRNVADKVQADEQYIQGRKEPEILAADVKFLESIASKIVVEDIAPQVISVEFVHKDKTKSKLWLSYLSAEVISEVERLNKAGDSKFEVTTFDTPIIKDVVPSYVINVIAGLMSGASIGGMIMFMRHYYQTSERV